MWRKDSQAQWSRDLAGILEGYSAGWEQDGLQGRKDLLFTKCGRVSHYFLFSWDSRNELFDT